jgi:hypothetical protein
MNLVQKMKPQIVLIINAALMSYIGIMIHPVFSLIFPITIIYIGLSVFDPEAWITNMVVASLILDSFSGMPFGLYTVSLIIIYALIYFARQFLFSSDFIFLFFAGAISTLLYMLMLSTWTGFVALSTHWKTITFTYILAIIVLKYAFRKISSRTI